MLFIGLLTITIAYATYSANAYLLVVKPDRSFSQTDDKFLRGYSAYYGEKANGDLKLKCSSPSWASSTSVQWNTDNSDVLTINSKTRTGEFTCLPAAVHSVQKDKLENTTVKVYRASPEVKLTPPSVDVVNYTNPVDIVISCSKDDKTFDWYLDGLKLSEGEKNIRIHVNNTLNVSKAGYKDVGVYMCKARDSGELNFYNVKGPVYFPLKHGKRDDSENKLEGSSVIVIHDVFGNPIPDLEWYATEDESDTPVPIDDEYLKKHPNVKFSPTVNVSNGMLEVSDLQKEDRAHYYSKAKNEYNSEEVQFKTLIRVKGKLDALWPFLGIVAEVIILVAIILIYERRRLKQDREAEEAVDQKKPLTSSNSENVRQRKN